LTKHAIALGAKEGENTLSKFETMCVMCNQCLFDVMTPLSNGEFTNNCFKANYGLMCESWCSSTCTDNKFWKLSLNGEDDSTDDDGGSGGDVTCNGDQIQGKEKMSETMGKGITETITYCDSCGTCSTTRDTGSISLASFKAQVPSTLLAACLLTLLAK